jgi:YegS/Rv2252/BmrU family lipid kinase
VYDAFLLANPVCLKRHGFDLVGLERLMADAGLKVQSELLAQNLDLDDLRERIETAAPNLLIAAGGDGTIHQVANVAVPLGLPMGVMPLGTANDFSRTLGLPTNPKEAAALIADGPSMPVDVGRVNGHYFLNAAHLGLGVETAKRTSPTLKHVIGPLAYMLAAAQAWMNAEPLEIECCFDDKNCVKMMASQLLVGNGRYFGGGNVVARDATLDDGLLDVYVLESDLGAAEALKMAAAVRQGGLEDQPGLFYARASRFTARMSRSTEVNLDGELIPMEAQLQFEVLPRALSVYARPVALDPLVAPDSLTPEFI